MFKEGWTITLPQSGRKLIDAFKQDTEGSRCKPDASAREGVGG
jgi:hypothetical protein